MNRILTAAFAFFVLSLITPTTIFAVSEPSFPICTNPQGTVKADYTSGTHGIVGNTASYTGKDKVYQVTPSTYTQCFCSDSGEGIQTNWWKADLLSEVDIAILKSQGWIFVPNGTLWGLENSPYFAKNSNYSCKSSSAQIGGASATNTSSGNGGSTLGLATTGNTSFLFSLATSGLVFIILSLLLRRTARER